MARHKIFITKEGNVISLCDDIIDNIPSLGKKTIKRETNIEFNNDSQLWEIIDLTGNVIGTNARRDRAIELEIKLVNERIKNETCKGEKLLVSGSSRCASGCEVI